MYAFVKAVRLNKKIRVAPPPPPPPGFEELKHFSENTKKFTVDKDEETT